MDGGQVRLLFKVIDWMMRLARPLDGEFWAQLREYEQERRMPYVTSVERIGREIGLEEGLAKGLTQGLTRGVESILRVRFGADGLAQMPDVRRITDTSLLERVLDEATSVGSLDELRKLWSSQA